MGIENEKTEQVFIEETASFKTKKEKEKDKIIEDNKKAVRQGVKAEFLNESRIVGERFPDELDLIEKTKDTVYDPKHGFIPGMKASDQNEGEMLEEKNDNDDGRKTEAARVKVAAKTLFGELKKEQDAERAAAAEAADVGEE